MPRVVSLLPSATEILCAIGAGAHLVGRSHECDFPPQVAVLPVLTGSRTTYDASRPDASAAIDAEVRGLLASGSGGGSERDAASASLYTLDEAALAALRPDLVLTQDLCSVCSIDLAAVARVASRLDPRPEVLSLNPHTLEGVFDDVLSIGEAMDRADPGAGGRWGASAVATVTALRERLYSVADYANPFADGPTVAFIEWCDPLFVGGHWTPQIIERAGGRHPLNPTEPVPSAGAAAGPIGATQRRAGKSIVVPAAVLVASRPEYLIVCPCGLTLAQARVETAKLARESWWAALPAVRAGRVAIVDGNQYFSRPGPRLVDAAEWLTGWVNDRPEVIPAGFAWEPWRP